MDLCTFNIDYCVCVLVPFVDVFVDSHKQYRCIVPLIHARTKSCEADSYQISTSPNNFKELPAVALVCVRESAMQLLSPVKIGTACLALHPKTRLERNGKQASHQVSDSS